MDRAVSFIFVLLSTLCFEAALSTQRLDVECLGESIDIPFYSRGMAKHCCHVYPNKLGKHAGGFFEAGSRNDPHYFYNSKIVDRDVLYIATADFPDFLDHFQRLPSTARIVLVTGLEDIGTPFELFHPSRDYRSYSMSGLWPNGQAMDMESFILDPRLVKWFVQNYDLVGCNHFTCSTITKDSASSDEKHKRIVAKVVPMPIGLDFHTLSEKQRHIKGAHQVSAAVCEQLRDHRAATFSNKNVGFTGRVLQANAEFECEFNSGSGAAFRKKTRGELCTLVEAAVARGDTRYTKRGGGVNSGTALINRKIGFWQRLATVAFSFSPPGYGMDTHRMWEILSMGTVPIVLSSPLDSLYSQFPVVIVDKWQDAFAEGALEKFRAEIVAKWGEQPFSHEVMHKLSLEYWMEKVNAAMPVVSG
jgi:hypothetical protein